MGLNLPKLDAVFADRVYDVLVREAGAQDDAQLTNRAMFVIAQANGCDEYRFGGLLGFGGKFRHDRHDPRRIFVDCYPEDLTPDRQRIIGRTNAALADLLLADGTRRFAADDARIAEENISASTVRGSNDE